MKQENTDSDSSDANENENQDSEDETNDSRDEKHAKTERRRGIWTLTFDPNTANPSVERSRYWIIEVQRDGLKMPNEGMFIWFDPDTTIATQTAKGG